MITIEVNGKPIQCNYECTVEEYVVSLGLETKHVAVAHNGVVLARTQFSQIRLSQGDTLEIVRPVGGG